MISISRSINISSKFRNIRPKLGNHRYFSLSNCLHSEASISQQVATGVHESAMKIGDLAAQGLCNNTPAGLVERLLEYNHVTSGLPWWATIVCTTFAVRFLMVPLNIKMNRASAELRIVQRKVAPLMDHYKAAKQVGNQDKAVEYMGQITEIYREHKVNPLKPLMMAFISGPIFMSFFLALRDIGNTGLPALKTGGTLWFHDLSVADPYMALPCAAAAGFLYVTERGMDTGQQQTEQMKMFLRIMSLAAIPVMSTMPSALSVYWASNSLFTAAMANILSRKSVKKSLKIPDVAPLSQEILSKNNSVGAMMTAADSVQATNRKLNKK